MSKKFCLKSLAKQEDGTEIPMTWGEWESLFGIDLYTLYEEARDYLEESGVLKVLERDPNEEIDALYVAINFDEWAPALFRRLDREKKKRKRREKRDRKNISFDVLENIPQNPENVSVKFPGDFEEEKKNPKDWLPPVKYPVDKEVAFRIIFMALLKKLISSNKIKLLGKSAKQILEVLIKNPGANQAEIAVTLNIKRETVNRTLKKIKTFLASPQ
jgi:hypothetical protein